MPEEQQVETLEQQQVETLDYISKLKLQRRQLDSRIRKAEKRETNAAKKARTRRAIVLGEAVIAAVAKKELASCVDGLYSPLIDVREWLLKQPLRDRDRQAWEHEG